LYDLNLNFIEIKIKIKINHFVVLTLDGLSSTDFDIDLLLLDNFGDYCPLGDYCGLC